MKIQVKKMFGPRSIWVKKSLVQKEILAQINYGSQKIGSKTFGQNWVSNSWYIAELYRCLQDICGLDKCHHDSWHLWKIVPGTYLESLVKIGSVTAEIFVIWTNVTWTNVAWANATMTVGICCRCFQEPIFKVSSKLGQ